MILAGSSIVSRREKQTKKKKQIVPSGDNDNVHSVNNIDNVDNGDHCCNNEYSNNWHYCCGNYDCKDAPKSTEIKTIPLPQKSSELLMNHKNRSKTNKRSSNAAAPALRQQAQHWRLCRGPGCLTRSLGLAMADNGADLVDGDRLWLTEGVNVAEFLEFAYRNITTCNSNRGAAALDYCCCEENAVKKIGDGNRQGSTDAAAAGPANESGAAGPADESGAAGALSSAGAETGTEENLFFCKLCKQISNKLLHRELTSKSSSPSFSLSELEPESTDTNKVRSAAAVVEQLEQRQQPHQNQTENHELMLMLQFKQLLNECLENLYFLFDRSSAKFSIKTSPRIGIENCAGEDAALPYRLYFDKDPSVSKAGTAANTKAQTQKKAGRPQQVQVRTGTGTGKMWSEEDQIKIGENQMGSEDQIWAEKKQKLIRKGKGNAEKILVGKTSKDENERKVKRSKRE